MLHPPEDSQCGAFLDRCHGENRRRTRVGLAPVLAPIKDELPILTKRLEYVFRKLHHTGLILGFFARPPKRHIPEFRQSGSAVVMGPRPGRAGSNTHELWSGGTHASAFRSACLACVDAAALRLAVWSTFFPAQVLSTCSRLLNPVHLSLGPELVSNCARAPNLRNSRWPVASPASRW